MAKKNLSPQDCLSSRKRVVGYIRVSTEEQAREGISLDAQKTQIEGYAVAKGFELVSIIREAGKSAKNLNREGFQKIRRMAQAGDIDGVVIVKLDRAFRDAEDALHISKEFDRKGVALHSINESLDTKSPMGKLFFTWIAGIAEMERNVISERTKTALAHKKARGERVGEVPYGYDSQDGKLIPNESEQDTLKVIKALHKKGYSLQAIANTMNAKGYQTKKRKPWAKHSVNHVLSQVVTRRAA